MKRAYVDIPEGQMHYRHAGAGSANVILLHMSGSSSDEYEQTGDLLAQQGYRVFAMDLLGFGSSDRPPRYYSLAEHANTVLEFMDALGLDKALIYGNLATANMAAHLGVTHPHRVSGLLLAHPLYSDDPVQYAKKKDLPEYSVIVPQADGSHMMELWARAFKYGEPPEICDARCRCLHAAGDLGESLHWALFEDTPVDQLFPLIKVPTVVAAYGSFREPELLGEVALRLIPDCKFHLLPAPGGTPYISRSNPQAVADLFTQYFSPAN